MIEILLVAQVATSDYVCWADLGYGTVNMSHLCGVSSVESSDTALALSAGEIDYLNYYNRDSLASLTGRDPLADGYMYCQMRQEMTDMELAGWRVDQADGLSAQDSSRVSSHWLTVSVGTSLYLCP